MQTHPHVWRQIVKDCQTPSKKIHGMILDRQWSGSVRCSVIPRGQGQEVVTRTLGSGDGPLDEVLSRRSQSTSPQNQLARWGRGRRTPNWGRSWGLVLPLTTRSPTPPMCKTLQRAPTSRAQWRTIGARLGRRSWISVSGRCRINEALSCLAPSPWERVGNWRLTHSEPKCPEYVCGTAGSVPVLWSRAMEPVAGCLRGNPGSRCFPTGAIVPFPCIAPHTAPCIHHLWSLPAAAND